MIDLRENRNDTYSFTLYSIKNYQFSLEASFTSIAAGVHNLRLEMIVEILQGFQY